jgi:hypothetical protein
MIWLSSRSVSFIIYMVDTYYLCVSMHAGALQTCYLERSTGIPGKTSDYPYSQSMQCEAYADLATKCVRISATPCSPLVSTRLGFLHNFWSILF